MPMMACSPACAGRRREQRHQEPDQNRRSLQAHAAPSNSDLAAIAMTFAEFTMSSIRTYSSG